MNEVQTYTAPALGVNQSLEVTPTAIYDFTVPVQLISLVKAGMVHILCLAGVVVLVRLIGTFLLGHLRISIDAQPHKPHHSGVFCR